MKIHIKTISFLLLLVLVVNPLCISATAAFEKPQGWNYTEFRQDVIGWFFQPFRIYVGTFAYLILLAGILACFYNGKHTIGSIVASILVVFAVFSSEAIFIQEETYSLFFSVITIAGIAAIILGLVLRRR
jgi:hypothetical protein